jgi:hypothetical protein
MVHGAGRHRDLPVHRKLLALIPGQRPPQRLRQPLQRACDRLTGPVGGREAVPEREQDHEPCGALHQRSDRRPVARAHDQVAFPVTGLDTILDLVGTLFDHPHRREPPAALQPKQTSPATPPTRGPGQLDRRVVNRLVDRLLAQPSQRLTGEQLAQLMRDLLRAPAFGQQTRDLFGQHRIDGDPSLARLAGAKPGGLLGAVRVIPAVRVAVAPNLAADRRRRPHQLQRDPANRHLRSQQIGDLDPLLR